MPGLGQKDPSLAFSPISLKPARVRTLTLWKADMESESSLQTTVLSKGALFRF